MDEQDHIHAGLGDRALAWMIDGMLAILLAFMVLFPILTLLGAVLPTVVTDAIIVGVLVLTSGAYYIETEARWARTPGKVAFGLKVVHTPTGNECTREGAIRRNITKVLGSNPLSMVVAVLMISASSENQRMGDVLGDTTVVYG